MLHLPPQVKFDHLIKILQSVGMDLDILREGVGTSLKVYCTRDNCNFNIERSIADYPSARTLLQMFPEVLPHFEGHNKEAVIALHSD